MEPRLFVFAQCICTISILVVACEPATSTSSPAPGPIVTSPATLTSPPLPVTTAKSTTENDSVTQNCLNVLPVAPTGFAAKGIIPLEDSQTGKTILLNLETGDELRIPAVEQYIQDYAVGPDQQTLAYKIRQNNSYLLVLRDALNTHHQVVLERQADFGLYGWLNNQQLFLGEPGKYVVFNPYTHAEKDYSNADFPDYDTDNARDDWVSLDTTLTRAIYKHSAIFLTNLESKQIIARIGDGFDRAPVAQWTTDGSEAAIVGTTAVGTTGTRLGDNIFGVSRDGQVTQLTHLAEKFGTGFNIHSMTWSPDSHHIAFWMWSSGATSNNWVLAVLDITTKQVTNYCISTNPYATINGRAYHQGLSAPIWSPDGKQVIVELRAEGPPSSIVLVDTTQNIAFQIAQNAYPVGWMLPITP